MLGPAWGSSTTSTATWLARRPRPREESGGDRQERRFHPSVQRRLEQAEAGPENGPESPACEADRAYRAAVRAAVTKTMDALKLDAFVYPTWSNPPRLIGDLNTPHGDNSQFFSPTTGFPAISVPMGYTRGGPSAGRDHVLRPGVVGAGVDQAGLRVRAGDAPRRPPESVPPIR